LDVGPKMDLIGLLAEAIRAQGLHFGAYHSLFEWFNPLYLQDKANNWTTNKYVTNILQPELYDLVNKYQVEVVWSDGDWEAPDTYWQSTNFLAWLYNDSPVKDTVVVNDRWGAGDPCKNGGYYTCTDRYNPGKLLTHKWENCYTIDGASWGFRRNANIQDYVSVQNLIYTLVSTVSCGGNLLLNVGPTKDGTIDAIFQDRLMGMGSWLKVNGMAIYSTKPWRVQNDTADLETTVWYTMANSTVFATSLTWPSGGNLTLLNPVASAQTTVSLVGYGAITYTLNTNKQLVLALPPFATFFNANAQMPQVGWVFALQNVQ